MVRDMACQIDPVIKVFIFNLFKPGFFTPPFPTHKDNGDIGFCFHQGIHEKINIFSGFKGAYKKQIR